MNRFLATSVFLFATCSLAFPLRGESPDPLTVMTWNLEWFYDDEQGDNRSELSREKSSPSRTEWNWRRDAVAKRIDQIQPTILAVQEVESRRILWYLTRSLQRNHSISYREIGFESRDHYTEQDVGILYRPPADLVLSSQFSLTERLKKSGSYYNVSKHLLAVFEYPVGDRFERVSIVNAHLRSGAKGTTVRQRQARTIHQWIRGAIERGEHLIVLGDFNTDESGTSAVGSDMAILTGKETPSAKDDLIDLHSQLPADQRQTHLLAGKQFDRILCTPSLFEDDPGRLDLVFRSIEVRPDLAIQGRVDTTEEHWDQYWQLPPDQRDLSDHYPVIATFVVQ